ncbi:MAG: alpha/beta fold hydrolase, partial [Pseudomonadota bacterium]
VYSFYGKNYLYRGNKLDQTRLVSGSFGGEVTNLVKPSRDQRQRGIDGKVAFAANQSDIIDMLPNDPEHILLAIDDRVDGNGYPNVRKINVRAGDYTVSQRAKKEIYDWLTDKDGTPLLGYGTYVDPPKVYIHKSKRDIWSQTAITALIDKSYYPIDLHEDGKTAIFTAKNEKGRRSLGRFDLTNGELVEWLYSNPFYDIDDLYYSQVNGRLVGTGYVDTVSRQIFMEGTEKNVLQSFNEQFPNTSNRLLSSDEEGRLWLISTDGGQSTPKIYAYDALTGGASVLADLYENIEDEDVAPVKAHRVMMRDGLVIEVYVTNPVGRGKGPLPTIMMPHGGPRDRDTAEFDYMAQLFANRGYRVIQPNFRGSTGYGSRFTSLAYRAWGGAMQDDVTDTAKWAIEQGYTDPERICIVGWSYGGYAAMMGTVKTPDLYTCAVSINGVIDLPMLWTDDRKFIWYRDMRESIGENRSDLKEISPFHQADKTKIPVLLVASKDDDRVSYRHSKRAYKALKKKKVDVTYIELKSGGHSVDVDAERITMFKGIDAFLAKHLGRNTDG